jgi:hypothetical protein
MGTCGRKATPLTDSHPPVGGRTETYLSVGGKTEDDVAVLVALKSRWMPPKLAPTRLIVERSFLSSKELL